jgi:hypothetical protein
MVQNSQKRLNAWLASLGRALLRRLDTPRKVYEKRIVNNLDSLYRVIRKGDVVLVEGRSEMSRIIQLLTQTVPLRKYCDDNIRICRGEDLKETYFYLDATPTHSYMKALYLYPQAEFPFAELAAENRRRGPQHAKYQPVVRLLGNTITLDNLEHDIVRKQYSEPRIHMALVCAARSCPKLRSEAYVADKLHAQLDDQSRRFLASPAGLRIDRGRQTVYFSSIFK